MVYNCDIVFDMAAGQLPPERDDRLVLAPLCTNVRIVFLMFKIVLLVNI